MGRYVTANQAATFFSIVASTIASDSCERFETMSRGAAAPHYAKAPNAIGRRRIPARLPPKWRSSPFRFSLLQGETPSHQSLNSTQFPHVDHRAILPPI